MPLLLPSSSPLSWSSRTPPHRRGRITISVALLVLVFLACCQHRGGCRGRGLRRRCHRRGCQWVPVHQQWRRNNSDDGKAAATGRLRQRYSLRQRDDNSNDNDSKTTKVNNTRRQQYTTTTPRDDDTTRQRHHTTTTPHDNDAMTMRQRNDNATTPHDGDDSDTTRRRRDSITRTARVQALSYQKFGSNLFKHGSRRFTKIGVLPNPERNCRSGSGQWPNPNPEPGFGSGKFGGGGHWTLEWVLVLCMEMGKGNVHMGEMGKGNLCMGVGVGGMGKGNVRTGVGEMGKGNLCMGVGVGGMGKGNVRTGVGEMGKGNLCMGVGVGGMGEGNLCMGVGVGGMGKGNVWTGVGEMVGMPGSGPELHRTAPRVRVGPGSGSGFTVDRVLVNPVRTGLHLGPGVLLAPWLALDFLPTQTTFYSEARSPSWLCRRHFFAATADGMVVIAIAAVVIAAVVDVVRVAVMVVATTGIFTHLRERNIFEAAILVDSHNQ
ncbi:hypothetical protein EDB85DRAFT_1892915 [Lactarius pseudohatsudake]|nr:hypothetical protein EDB85DRAFT_1892915 [Lactarius pseudohatsudake]